MTKVLLVAVFFVNNDTGERLRVQLLTQARFVFLFLGRRRVQSIGFVQNGERSTTMSKPSIDERVDALEKSVSRATLLSALAAALATVAAAAISSYFSAQVAAVQKDVAATQASASAGTARMQRDIEELKLKAGADLERFRQDIANQQREADAFDRRITESNDPSRPMSSRAAALKLLMDGALACDRARLVAGVLSTLGAQEYCNQPCDALEKKHDASAAECYNACADLSQRRKKEIKEGHLCKDACKSDGERVSCNRTLTEQ